MRQRKYSDKVVSFLQDRTAEGDSMSEAVTKANKAFTTNIPMKTGYYLIRSTGKNRKARKCAVRTAWTKTSKEDRAEILQAARELNNKGVRWSAICDQLQGEFPFVQVPSAMTMSRLARGMSVKRGTGCMLTLTSEEDNNFVFSKRLSPKESRQMILSLLIGE